MKFVILKINCDISDISILKDNNKNIVFDNFDEIDAYFVKENLEQNDYSILCIDRKTHDFEKILQDNINKLI
jgi:hypothetical protein